MCAFLHAGSVFRACVAIGKIASFALRQSSRPTVQPSGATIPQRPLTTSNSTVSCVVSVCRVLLFHLVLLSRFVKWFLISWVDVMCHML